MTSSWGAQGFQRVSDNLGEGAPAMREKFEAIAAACARSASLDGSFPAPAQAAANGHSSSSPEAKASRCWIFFPARIPTSFLREILHVSVTYE